MLTKYDYLVQLEYLSMVYGQLLHTIETRLTMQNYFVALRLSMVYGPHGMLHLFNKAEQV